MPVVWFRWSSSEIVCSRTLLTSTLKEIRASIMSGLMRLVVWMMISGRSIPARRSSRTSTSLRPRALWRAKLLAKCRFGAPHAVLMGFRAVPHVFITLVREDRRRIRKIGRLIWMWDFGHFLEMCSVPVVQMWSWEANYWAGRRKFQLEDSWLRFRCRRPTENSGWWNDRGLFGAQDWRSRSRAVVKIMVIYLMSICRSQLW